MRLFLVQAWTCSLPAHSTRARPRTSCPHCPQPGPGRAGSVKRPLPRDQRGYPVGDRSGNARTHYKNELGAALKQRARKIYRATETATQAAKKLQEAEKGQPEGDTTTEEYSTTGDLRKQTGRTGQPTGDRAGHPSRHTTTTKVCTSCVAASAQASGPIT
jgi:hypothetical protein